MKKYKLGEWEFGQETILGQKLCFLEISPGYIDAIALALTEDKVLFIVRSVTTSDDVFQHIRIYVRPENLHCIEQWCNVQ